MKTENLEDNLWAFAWVGGYKPHFVPKRLTAALVAELEMRQQRDYPECGGEGSTQVEPRESGVIDLPGMCMVDRPHEEIKIDTFKLSIPSQDFKVFLRELALAPKRKFSDGQEYYKIHGWRVCVVFTLQQRDLVLHAMEEMLNSAEKRGNDADEEFSRRMAEINKDGPRVISHRDKKSPYVKKVPKPPKENN
jgi:hypothetical protein